MTFKVGDEVWLTGRLYQTRPYEYLAKRQVVTEVFESEGRVTGANTESGVEVAPFGSEYFEWMGAVVLDPDGGVFRVGDIDEWGFILGERLYKITGTDEVGAREIAEIWKPQTIAELEQES